MSLIQAIENMVETFGCDAVMLEINDSEKGIVAVSPYNMGTKEWYAGMTFVCTINALKGLNINMVCQEGDKEAKKILEELKSGKRKYQRMA